MRIIVAEMSHETNTFSPVVTDLARFSHGATVPQEGDGAIATFRGTATGLGGFIAVCESVGAQIILPIAAGAPPSGRVEDAAFEYIAQKIVTAAAARMRRDHARPARRDGDQDLRRR